MLNKKTLLDLIRHSIVFEKSSRIEEKTGHTQTEIIKKLAAMISMTSSSIPSDEGNVYGFAKYMRDALPNATCIGFTGTNIEKDDVNTPAVSANCVNIYDIAQPVEDGATVRIFEAPEQILSRAALSWKCWKTPSSDTATRSSPPPNSWTS